MYYIQAAYVKFHTNVQFNTKPSYVARYVCYYKMLWPILQLSNGITVTSVYN